MSLREQIGQRIRARRIALGMSQQELAEALGYKNRSMVSLIEAGRRALDVDQMKPLVKALHCSIDDLIDGEETVDNKLSVILLQLTPEQKESALRFLQSMIAKR